MGLKHPFESPNILPSDKDDTNHSIMSYTDINSYIPILSFSNTKIFMDYKTLLPDFYSIYDVASLQNAYGVNKTTNLEDATYTTKFTDYKIQAIWDAGGTDTIDLSDTIGKSTIDLNAGSLNSADQYSLDQVISMNQDIAAENGKSQHDSWIASTITDLYNQDRLYTGIDNLAIATGTVIENLLTGSGDDVVTDNEVNNFISTSFGDDTIYLGSGGNDTIDGGDGDDTIHLNLSQSEVEFIVLDEDSYLLVAQNFAAEFTNIESIEFSTGISYTPDILIG